MLSPKDKEHIRTTLLPLRVDITKLEQQHRHAFLQANAASFSSQDAKKEAKIDRKTRTHIRQLWQLHENTPFRHFFAQVPTQQQVYDLDNAFDQAEDNLQAAQDTYQHALQQLGGFHPNRWLPTKSIEKASNTLSAQDVYALLSLNTPCETWQQRNLYGNRISIQQATIELSIGILSHNSWLRAQELPHIESYFFKLLQQGNGHTNSVPITS